MNTPGSGCNIEELGLLAEPAVWKGAWMGLSLWVVDFLWFVP